MKITTDQNVENKRLCGAHSQLITSIAQLLKLRLKGHCRRGVEGLQDPEEQAHP